MSKKKTGSMPVQMPDNQPSWKKPIHIEASYSCTGINPFICKGGFHDKNKKEQSKADRKSAKRNCYLSY